MQAFKPTIIHFLNKKDTHDIVYPIREMCKYLFINLTQEKYTFEL